MKECECPVEHTVAKLGHCRTCPYYIEGEPSMLEVTASSTLFVCGADKHPDGTPHDFDWATYADETTSYGVCRCGYDSMSQSLMGLP